ncbi:MAG: hypothetical protein GAK45_02444 [Pseudomonas citronellolis]|nr:MAG: hypothetical protein GAK45_02444 [Pseudomonas citronellolis]
MKQIQQWFWVGGMVAALSPVGASALELGDISAQTALGQAFNASIALNGGDDLEDDDVHVKLAPGAEFERLGVQRLDYLSALRFEVHVGRGGRGTIRVHSDRPMNEPYLSFVVEVAWPQGHMVREYTVLIDPPEFAAPAQVAMPVVAPVGAQSVSGRVASSGAENHRIQRGDTLWRIASRHRAGWGVSAQQTMAAILALNPKAFINGDINRPRVGAVLRLPGEGEVRAKASAAAVAVVRTQSQRGRPAARRQLDASQRAVAGVAPAHVAARDSLRLVSGKASPASEKQAGAERMAVLKEGLDSARREGDELKSRIADLQRQLDKLSTLLELKDAQMAALVAQLAASGRAPAERAEQQEGASSADPQGTVLPD